MPKNAQQVIEGFKSANQEQQYEQVQNLRRAAYAINQLAGELSAIEDDERFPVERKRDAFNLHRFANSLQKIADQATNENVSEKQIDKAINTMAGIDMGELLSRTIDKETAGLLEHPELEGKTYFEAVPELFKTKGLQFNQQQFKDSLGFVNNHFELENDLRPLGIHSAPGLGEATEDDFEAMAQELMSDEYNPAEAADEIMRQPSPQNQRNTAPQTEQVNTAPQQNMQQPQQNMQQRSQQGPQPTVNTTQQRPQQGPQPTVNTMQQQPQPAAGGPGPIIIGGNKASAPQNAQIFSGLEGEGKFRDYMDGQLKAAEAQTDPELKSVWEKFLNCLFNICEVSRNNEPANDLQKQIQENGMNFSDPKSAKQMVDHVRRFTRENLTRTAMEKVEPSLFEMDRISNHLAEHVANRAYTDANPEKDDAQLKDLQTMFSTRSGRLAVNSSEYRKAKADLDTYVKAREDLQKNYKNALEDTLYTNDKARLDNYKAERKALEAKCAEAEKNLKTSMTAYVKHASKNGTKSIDQMSHGYGAARLASGNGVLEFLDRNNKAAQRSRQNAPQKRQAERAKEISYRDLYTQNRKANEAGKDRRTKAANAALDNVKKEKGKQAMM